MSAPFGDKAQSDRRTVKVDLHACGGFGQCIFAAPDTFLDFDDDGKVVYEARPGVEQRAAIESAARACPTGAIEIVENAAASTEPEPVATTFVDVAGLDEISDREIRRYAVGGFELILVRSAELVKALQAICTHAKAFLGPGYLTRDRHIECPMHEAWFTLDGEVVKGPPKQSLTTYPTRLEGGRIFVGLPILTPADAES